MPIIHHGVFFAVFRAKYFLLNCRCNTSLDRRRHSTWIFLGVSPRTKMSGILAQQFSKCPQNIWPCHRQLNFSPNGLDSTLKFPRQNLFQFRQAFRWILRDQVLSPSYFHKTLSPRTDFVAWRIPEAPSIVPQYSKLGVLRPRLIFYNIWNIWA